MRKIYPKVRNGRYENRGMPPHVVLHDAKEVLFFIPNGMPTTLGIPTFMRQFPDGYRGVVVRSAETFKKFQEENPS